VHVPLLCGLWIFIEWCHVVCLDTDWHPFPSLFSGTLALSLRLWLEVVVWVRGHIHILQCLGCLAWQRLSTWWAALHSHVKWGSWTHTIPRRGRALTPVSGPHPCLYAHGNIWDASCFALLVLFTGVSGARVLGD